MAYDLEEQEQLDELKAWWKTYGKMIISGVLVIIVAYVGYQSWEIYKNKQSKAASTLFQALQVIDENDLKAVQEKSALLMDKYSATPYAARAALFAAKANYQAKEIKSAKTQLEWAAKNAKETAISAIATLQLASILMEEKNYQAALKLLEASHDPGFVGLFSDLKGDVLLALGKKSEAKSAYEFALTKLDPNGKHRLITQKKLEALG